MSQTLNPVTEPGDPTIYHIRLKGRLDLRWKDWFGGMSIAPQPNGETLLAGPVIDQAELHGILTRIRDLGLLLISVTRVEPHQRAP